MVLPNYTNMGRMFSPSLLFPQHPSLLHLLTDVDCILLRGAQLSSCCCQELGHSAEGEGLYITPLFFSQKIQGLFVCHLLSTGTFDKAFGGCGITACLSPRGRTPTRRDSSRLCRAMPGRLDLTAYVVVGFLAMFYT